MANPISGTRQARRGPVPRASARPTVQPKELEAVAPGFSTTAARDWLRTRQEKG
jgi:hypothetical protein